MQNNLLRPNFYEGQILGSTDLKRGIEYAREQDARHERYLHTWGLAEGLELKEQNGEWLLTPGFAIDSAGAPVVVASPLMVEADQLHDDALPSDRDDGKWFPVFVVRTEKEAEADRLVQRCGTSGRSRIAEGATIVFRSFATDWDDQNEPRIGEGPGSRPDRSRVVLIGFVEWNKEPSPKGAIKAFSRRNPDTGEVPKYAGVAADDVIARGSELALWSRRPNQQVGTPAVLLGDHRAEDDKDRKALRLGLDDGKGKLNELVTVDPQGNLFLKGNLTAEGVIQGKLTKGEVSIESGIAGDGMTLPLPPEITYQQVDDGDVVLHTSVTPRLDRLVDPINITEKHVPLVMECSVDDELLVSCLIKWYEFGQSAGLDVAGTVDYTIIAYVNKADSGESE